MCILGRRLEGCAELEGSLVDLAQLVERAAERLVIGRARAVELDRLAQLLDALLVLLEEQQRAAALLVRRGIVGVERDHRVRDVERLLPLVTDDQRLGVEVVPLHVGRVRVVVLLGDFLRAGDLAGVDQEVDALLEDVEALAGGVRLIVLLVRASDVAVLGEIAGVREHLPRVDSRRLLHHLLDRLLGAAARGGSGERGARQG